MSIIFFYANLQISLFKNAIIFFKLLSNMKSKKFYFEYKEIEVISIKRYWHVYDLNE